MSRKSGKSIEATHLPESGKTKQKRFQPAIGRDFATEAEVIEAQTAQNIANSRDRLALIVVALIAASILFAATLSIIKGDFSFLSVLWAVVGPIAGAILGHYFRPNKRE